MEPTTQNIEQPHNNILRIVIIVVFILLVVGIGGGLYYMYSSTNSQQANEQNSTENSNNPNTNPTSDQEDPNSAPNRNVQNQQANNPQEVPTVAPTETPPFDPAKSWVKLETEGGGTTLPVGEEGNIILTAFSAGENIDGYDIMLGFDPEKVEIVEVTSLLDTHDMFETIRSDYVSATAIKPPDIEQETVFDETALVQYTIRALEPGETEISILPTKSVETTQLTNEDALPTSPQVDSLTIEIE
jgi:septal ring-binding cell division protein DamX